MTDPGTKTPKRERRAESRFETPCRPPPITLISSDIPNINSKSRKRRGCKAVGDGGPMGTATNVGRTNASPAPHFLYLYERWADKDDPTQIRTLSTPRRSKRASIRGFRGLHVSDIVDDSIPTTPTRHNYAFNHLQSHYIHFNDGDGDRDKGFCKTKSSIMASATGKWREEQILIICPGSRTTMAQLGCNELTPPIHRLPTRMFRDGQAWRPYYTFKRTKIVDGAEQEEWVEDVDEDKDAVWPIQGGRIVQMEAFLAFLDHVHGMLTTTYHNTPIMLMASPQWTRPDCEMITRFIFEKTKTPALCMIHSGLATQYGLKWPNMTVVDIGYEKVDVTAIHDGRVVNHMDLGSTQPDRQISGGEVFTQSLLKLLESKGFNHDMVEQLKKNPICEVLPYAPAKTDLMELPVDTGALTEAPSGATGGGPITLEDSNSPVIHEPPRPVEHNVDDGEGAEMNVDDEGVLDVAGIVTSGQTKEFLAKKDKEREKSRPGRKPKDKEAEATRPIRLPNSKKARNTFFYEEIVLEEVPIENGGTLSSEKPAGADGERGAEIEVAISPTADGVADPSVPKPAEPNTDVASAHADIKPETSLGSHESTELRPKRIRRDIEVGLERFIFAERKEIDRIVRTIYLTIQGIDDMYMRPACWDNLVFVGNGSRLRGLKDNIFQTLQARYLISPSTATIFTSELPSNAATPAGTGSQTPTGSFAGAPHQLSSSGVNPLLQAATTASIQGIAATSAAIQATTLPPGSEAAGPASSHHFHSQTPTSIKMAMFPTYLSEWTKNGLEEAAFLGAQVAARVAFCLHSNVDAQGLEAQKWMSLSRVEYNELGPKAIRTRSMLS